MRKLNTQLTITLTIVSAIIIIFNQYLIFAILPANNGKMKLSGNLSQDVITLVMSAGIPTVYGAELNVNYDDVQNSMNMMKQFDPGYGKNKITLSGDMQQRYIDITTKTACEFCCGAKALSFDNGKPACGCAHSQAMRGLTAYLLQNYGDQYDNDQILREISKWKNKFFPKQMIKKITNQIQTGKFTPDVASILMDVDVSKYNNYADTPLPSDIKGLPEMVGGC